MLLNLNRQNLKKNIYFNYYCCCPLILFLFFHGAQHLYIRNIYSSGRYIPYPDTIVLHISNIGIYQQNNSMIVIYTLHTHTLSHKHLTPIHQAVQKRNEGHTPGHSTCLCRIDAMAFDTVAITATDVDFHFMGMT